MMSVPWCQRAPAQLEVGRGVTGLCHVLFNPYLGLVGSWGRSQLAPRLDGGEYEASSKMRKGKCSESPISIHTVFQTVM